MEGNPVKVKQVTTQVSGGTRGKKLMPRPYTSRHKQMTGPATFAAALGEKAAAMLRPKKHAD